MPVSDEIDFSHGENLAQVVAILEQGYHEDGEAYNRRKDENKRQPHEIKEHCVERGRDYTWPSLSTTTMA
jgi:hypothetical protein